jgi:hypothetical protein
MLRWRSVEGCGTPVPQTSGRHGSVWSSGTGPAPSRLRRRQTVSTHSKLSDTCDQLILTTTITKPLGLMLEERKLADGTATVVIEAIEPEGNADLDGTLCVGDTLIACSAIMMAGERGKDRNNNALYNRDSRGKKGGCCSTGCPDCPFNHRNWERVVFDCRGKSFETVIAALQSNFQARWLGKGVNRDVSITISVSRD